MDAPRLNAVGDLVLTDPAAMRALADPLRLTLFDLVRRAGGATSEALAEQADEDAARVDRDLRELASFGLIEGTTAADGEMHWTPVGKGIYFEIPEEPEGQAAARQLSKAMLAKYADLPATWLRDDEPKLEVDWARAAGLFNARVELTPREVGDIHDGLERLLEPFTTRSPDEMPTGVRPVRILSFFMPEAERAAR